MNHSLSIFLINPSARAIMAQYESGAKARMFKTFDPTIKVDDLIVVPTPSEQRLNCTTCKVTEVDIDIDFDSIEKVLWVISKVDIEPYKKTLEGEDVALKMIRSAELRQKREALAGALFKDNIADIKALPIANVVPEGTVHVSAQSPISSTSTGGSYSS